MTRRPPPADLVLTGGRIATMDAARTLGERARRPRRPDRGGRARTRPSRPLIGPRTRVIELRGRTVTPGFQDAHVHPVHGGLDDAPLRPARRPRGRDALTSTIIAAYAAAHPDEPWIRGGGWSMADFPGGTPRREDLDRIVPDRPVFLTNRDGHGAWVNTRALELAGITAATAGPGRRPDRARPGRHAERHAPRRRDGPGRAPAPADDTPAELERGACDSARPPPRARASRPGRTRSSSRTTRSAPTSRSPARRADRPGRRGAVVGARPRRASRSRSSSSGAPRDRDRPLRADERQADDGRRPRELHRRDARAVPRRPTARRPTTAGSLQIDPDGARDAGSPRARCARVPAALPRHRRPGGPRRARRRRGGPRAPTARPTRGRTSPTSRSSTPTTSRASAALDVAANAQPLWAVPRGPDGRPDDPVPRRPSWRLAVPVPLAPGRGRRLAMGSDWSVSSAEPAARDGGRRRPASTASPCGERAAVPARGAARPRSMRSRAFTAGLGLRQPPRRRDRHARGRQARRPGRPRPRPVRPRRRRDRRGRGSSGRSSRAWPSTRTPRSRAERAARPASVRHGRMTMSNSASDVGVRRRPTGRCSRCTPIHGETERRDRAMNAYAIFAVNEHMESLIEESRPEPGQEARPSRASASGSPTRPRASASTSPRRRTRRARSSRSSTTIRTGAEPLPRPRLLPQTRNTSALLRRGSSCVRRQAISSAIDVDERETGGVVAAPVDLGDRDGIKRSP